MKYVTNMYTSIFSYQEEPVTHDDAATPGTSSTLNEEGPESSQDVEKSTNNDNGTGASNKRRGQNKKRTVDDESVKRDENTIYGELVACELRKLNPTVQTIAKHLINNVLFEAAMGKYDNADQSY